MSALWTDERPRSAAENLRSYVYQLRRLLGDGNRIVRRPPGYALLVEQGELDSLRFEELAEYGREFLAAGAGAHTAAVLREALSLWRGPAFSGLPGARLDEPAARLDELRLVVTERRVDADLLDGRHADLTAELYDLVAAHPLRERFRAQLMLALYRSGRQAEALQVYREARRVLVAELGLEPGAELQQLHAAILSGDRAFDQTRPGLLGGPAEVVTGGPVDGSSAPNLLPADIADFTGRTAEIELLCRELMPREGVAVPLCVLAGRGGVGKTALAVHVAHRMRDVFRDGQLYVNLHGVEAHPANPLEVLGRFLRAFGVDGSAIPDCIDERAEMFRTRLAERNVLVVLDNAADVAQIEPLLPGNPGCGVLVTSRGRLTGIPGAHLLELETLHPEQAVELLATVSGRDRIDAEPETAMELVRLCGHLPLAVRIAGARLAGRPHWTVARMAARLADEGRRLDELVHGHLDMRASLALSYRGLDVEGKDLFTLVGMLDAPDFAAWTAAALLDTTVEAAEEVLDRLVDAQLLDVSGTVRARYRLHDLVRAYARERGVEAGHPATREQALARAVGGWLYLTEQAHIRHMGGNYLVIHGNAARWCPDTAYVDRLLADPLAWSETERLGIVATVRQAGEAGLTELCWDLAVTAAPLFEVHGHNDDWQQTHQNALVATRTENSQRGHAAVLTELGELRIAQHRYEQASGLIEQALRIFEELGDRHGHAVALQKMAVLDRLHGRYTEAGDCYLRVIPTFHEVGDLGNEVLALRGIGQIHLELGHTELALTYLERALATALEAGARHQYAQTLYRLGEAYLQLGQVDAAQRALVEVLELVGQFNDRLGQAWALHGLGRVRIGQKRYQQAAKLLSRALTLSLEINAQMVQGRILLALGEAQHGLGQLDSAIGYLTRSAAICRDTNAPLWEAKALHALGNAHLDTGGTAAAEIAWRQALARYTDIGSTHVLQVSNQLQAVRLHD